MKKIIFLLVAILIVGTALFFLFRNNGPNVYENSRYEFSVEYPAGWSLGEAPTNNDGREFFSPDSTLSCRAYGFQNALLNEEGNPQSLNEFIDWLGGNLGDEVLKKSDTTLSGLSAVELRMKTGDVISQGVYVLGEESGRGIVCYYPDETSMNKFQADFEKMRKSFYLKSSLDGEKPKNIAACTDLANGVLAPFKDLQTFTDTNYTEVTITDRDYWDEERLPAKVSSLQSDGYTCYPLPLEFEGGEPEGGVMAEPAVTKVEWSCELEYNEWKYFSKDNFDLATKKAEGYECVKETCWQDPVGEDFVWLCTK